MDITQAKILIVEDEPQINRLIELVLLSDGYYNLQKAFDGQEALNLIRTNKPDLVLLDVMLPKINGFEVCKTIKNDEFLNSTQVIMLTAKKMEEDIVQGFENGAIDYISKPFSNKILLARIKAHLNNLLKNNSYFKYKNIILDDNKKTVKVDNTDVALTNFEYKLFKIFLGNVGKVFSRTQLLSFLRGDEGFNVSERAVDVQILNLRRKLGTTGANIETIRGIGYKLKEQD